MLQDVSQFAAIIQASLNTTQVKFCKGEGQIDKIIKYEDNVVIIIEFEYQSGEIMKCEDNVDLIVEAEGQLVEIKKGLRPCYSKN